MCTTPRNDRFGVFFFAAGRRGQREPMPCLSSMGRASPDWSLTSAGRIRPSLPLWGRWQPEGLTEEAAGRRGQREPTPCLSSMGRASPDWSLTSAGRIRPKPSPERKVAARRADGRGIQHRSPLSLRAIPQTGVAISSVDTALHLDNRRFPRQGFALPRNDKLDGLC